MSVASVRMDVAPASRMLFMQIRTQLIGYVRIPAFSVTSLVLPMMFWLFFGLPNAHQTMRGGMSARAYGLFVPAEFLPDVVQKITVYLPLYHYGQLAWDTIGAASEPIWKAALGLLIWAVILFALAVRAYRLDQTRKFA